MMMGLDLILLVVIAGVIVYALGRLPQLNQTRRDQTGQSSEEILKARYARGEINREEYDRVRRDLEG